MRTVPRSRCAVNDISAPMNQPGADPRPARGTGNEKGRDCGVSALGRLRMVVTSRGHDRLLGAGSVNVKYPVMGMTISHLPYGRHFPDNASQGMDAGTSRESITRPGL
ncbi:hypothetical protein GCM10017673_00990 [Streptosporangium violaceochromogenes]|nr:hypothetical protein GCM10017673_00990 [Streptosporangium violaceochromogenes]